jgi:hypothetical protein
MWLAQKIVEGGRERWARLSPDEQRALPRLLKTSKGRGSNLTPAEREELRRIVDKARGRVHT